jgi:hypothetical protein
MRLETPDARATKLLTKLSFRARFVTALPQFCRASPISSGPRLLPVGLRRGPLRGSHPSSPSVPPPSRTPPPLSSPRRSPFLLAGGDVEAARRIVVGRQCWPPLVGPGPPDEAFPHEARASAHPFLGPLAPHGMLRASRRGWEESAERAPQRSAIDQLMKRASIAERFERRARSQLARERRATASGVHFGAARPRSRTVLNSAHDAPTRRCAVLVHAFEMR